MPRFFLNIEHHDGTPVIDDPGADFQDRDAALAEARSVAIELVSEAMRGQQVRSPAHIVVADPESIDVENIAAESTLPFPIRK